MKHTLAILAVLALTGCATTVVEWKQVDPSTERITTNSRCAAEWSTTKEGVTTRKIDTMSQTYFDRLKAAMVNMFNYIGRSLDSVEPKVGK